MLRRRTAPLTLAVLLTVLALDVSSAARASQQPEVFSSPSERIAANRATVRQPEPDDPRYRRSRLAVVNVPLLVAARTTASLSFNLFDDITLPIVFDKIITHREGHSFIGRVLGEPLSTVLFEQIDEVMVGAVQTAQGRYVVRFAGGGLHSIHQSRPDVQGHADDFLDAPLANAEIPFAVRSTKAKKKFNYLGLYTRAALAEQGSTKAMKAAVRLTVTWLNQALRAQNVKHTVKFRGIKRVKGSDDGVLLTALRGVTNQSDGIFDETGRLRDRKSADFVGIYIKGDGTGFGTCGLGWRPRDYSAGNQAFAYHAVREDCNVRGSGRTGAHEVLHNMGGCHPNDSNDGCFNDATPNGGTDHGFMSVSLNFQTTLGTGALCARCIGLMTVSGPKPFRGARVSDAMSKIARLVNKGAKTYAAYR